METKLNTQHIKRPNTLLVVAGGSGGHILPALTLATNWKQERINRRIIVITGATPLEKHIMEQQSDVDRAIFAPLTKWSLRRWFALPLLLLQLAHLCLKTFIVAIENKPSRVLTTGGIHALPVCFAAWIMRLPIDVYELNVVPGKAVVALKFIASNLFCVFLETRRYLPKSTQVDYPIRADIQEKRLPHEELITRINEHHKHDRHWLPLEAHRRTIFMLGGSQGSLLLNKLIKEFLAQHPALDQRIQVIHQTGSFEETDWQAFYHRHQIPAVTFSYDPMITRYYQIADLIICRAGAGTLFEIAYLKRPCIVIPLVASTTDHQLYNAQAMASLFPQLFTVMTQQEIAQQHEKLFAKITAILQL